MTKKDPFQITGDTRLNQVKAMVAELADATPEVWSEACRRMWQHAADHVAAHPDENPADHLMLTVDVLAMIKRERLAKARVARVAA